MPDSEWHDKVDAALRGVSLEPGQVLNKYPHQLSGGQLQRLLVARALLLDLKILVADEIISMLDASTRIDVLNLLADLKGRGLGILFITHDLSLGNYISEKTVILRRGADRRDGRDGEGLRQSHASLHARCSFRPSPSCTRSGQTWRPRSALAAETARGRACSIRPIHRRPRAALAEDAPTLVKVEDEHFVGCFDLGQGICRVA